MNKNYIVSNLKLLSSEKASLCKNNHQAMSVAWEQTLNIRMSALLSGAQWSPRHCLGQAGCLKTPLLHSVLWLSLMLIDSAYATVPNWGERCPSSSKPGEVSEGSGEGQLRGLPHEKDEGVKQSHLLARRELVFRLSFSHPKLSSWSSRDLTACKASILAWMAETLTGM